jgi:hypothetical protein
MTAKEKEPSCVGCNLPLREKPCIDTILTCGKCTGKTDSHIQCGKVKSLINFVDGKAVCKCGNGMTLTNKVEINRLSEEEVRNVLSGIICLEERKMAMLVEDYVNLRVFKYMETWKLSVVILLTFIAQTTIIIFLINPLVSFIMLVCLHLLIAADTLAIYAVCVGRDVKTIVRRTMYVVKHLVTPPGPVRLRFFMIIDTVVCLLFLGLSFLNLKKTIVVTAVAYAGAVLYFFKIFLSQHRNDSRYVKDRVALAIICVCSYYDQISVPGNGKSNTDNKENTDTIATSTVSESYVVTSKQRKDTIPVSMERVWKMLSDSGLYLFIEKCDTV